MVPAVEEQREQVLGIGRPFDAVEGLVGEQAEQPASDCRKFPHVAVMHEREAPHGEGMAVELVRRDPRRCRAHVRERAGSAGQAAQMVQVANAARNRYVLSNLSAGIWYFAVAAYTKSGVQSDYSEIVFKAIQ